MVKTDSCLFVKLFLILEIFNKLTQQCSQSKAPKEKKVYQKNGKSLIWRVFWKDLTSSSYLPPIIFDEIFKENFFQFPAAYFCFTLHCFIAKVSVCTTNWPNKIISCNKFFHLWQISWTFLYLLLKLKLNLLFIYLKNRCISDKQL